MPSIHVIRWIENLKSTTYELYWFDILGRGKIEVIDKVCQITDWKKRKIPHLKGEYFLYKKFPFLYNIVQPFLEITANEQLEKIIQEIQPDIIHSFEMQSCSYPIIKTMDKYPQIKWLYSCWGNDLFYFQNFKNHNIKIRQVLNRVNFLHTDCKRDFVLATKLDFRGIHLGTIPGGTGYEIDKLDKYRLPLQHRKTILIKGYEHLFGRALVVVKALKELQSELQNYDVVVFGAHPVVVEFINKNRLPFTVYDRNGLKHNDLLKLMGQSLIYIGNSISDGMPNTLLEAIVMGAFPIQSNPGGATEEIISNGENGLLINNPNDKEEIKGLLLQTLLNKSRLEVTFVHNQKLAKSRLDYNDNKQKVISLYENIRKQNLDAHRF